MNAIEIRGLCKKYKKFSLQSLDLVLPEGCIMGLAGENGAGKSTTIKLILNAISRDSGEITVLGVDNLSPEFTSVKEDIGVVLDEACFPDPITVKQVNGIMKNIYRNWNEDVYYDYVDRFELPEKQMFKEYSKGMKMKLAIAVALSHDPKLLILDEATSGLDPIVRDEILDVFNDFTRDEKHSVLLSSHIISDMEKICDYFAFIHKGKLMLCDEKDAVLNKYGVLKLSKEEFEAVPVEAIHGKKETDYGIEVLVEKALVSSAFEFEHTTLEDIILFLAKEDRKK
jgi:ABC-2 type transport system ATP-binding protein